MTKGKRLVLLVVLLLLTVGSYTLISKNLAATGTDQNGNSWTYTTSGSTITITKYNTTNKAVVTVPRPMTINGTSYSTVILQGNVFQDHTEITTLTLSSGIKSGTSCSSMFRRLTNMTTLNLNNFDTSSATDMFAMFYQDSKLTSLNVNYANFKTNSVTNMQSMFGGCSSLTSLNLSSFNTQSVSAIGFDQMFSGCSSLKTLNISSFDTSNATYLGGMFDYCVSLELLDISSFDMTKVTYIFDNYYNFRIKLGNNRLNNKSGFFMRGTWKREEDGIEYSAIEIYKKMLNGQAAGTYTKLSNISKEMKITFPVDYKIKPLNGIDEFSTTNSNIVKEGNEIYVTNVPLTTTSEYTIPGSFTILMKDVVTDKNDNKYNLKLTMNNMKIVDLHAYSGISTFVMRPLHVSSNISLGEDFYKSLSDKTPITTAAYNNPSPGVKYDVKLQIVDSNGNVRNGSFIFSATDFDTSTFLDADSAYKDPYFTNRGFWEYSEGINLGAGMDLSTITMTNPTFLISPSAARITGTRIDSGTELSEFLAKADASNTNFTWTAGGPCGSEILSYYQPSIVEIKKIDNHGNSVAGAKLQLYYGDELYNGPRENTDNTWITTNDVKKIFLMPGEYTLKEVTHPNQYESSEDIKFFVDINDKLTINNEEVNDIEMIDNLVKKKYRVNYLEKGTNKVLSPQKISSDTEYGTTINSNDEKIDITNYKFDSSDKNSITIDVDESKNIINLYYTRVEKTVTINKLVYGNMADINKEFNFNVEVKDIDGVKDNNLSTSFKLKDKVVKTLSIPIGYTITITEDIDNNYTTTVNNSNTNTITKVVNDNETITFKNTYNDSSSTGIISIITPYLLLIIVSIILIGGYSFVSNRIKV